MPEITWHTADRNEIVAEGQRLETAVASLLESIRQISEIDCKHCESMEIAGGALAYAPHQHELGLINRELQAENRGLIAQGRGAIRALSECRTENVRLRDALEEILALSDRKHDAWARARAALESNKPENIDTKTERVEPFTRTKTDEYAVPEMNQVKP
jgi:hypothetical protein